MGCVEQQTLTKHSLCPISIFDQPTVVLTYFWYNTNALPGGAQAEEAEMWGGIIGLIIQLISGAVGGNIAGAAMKQYNLGTIGNSIAGLIGGGVGAILARSSVRSPPAVSEEAS